jgi:hypothetical protein
MDLGFPPSDVADFQTPKLAVPHPRRGGQQHQCAISLAYGIRSIDRVDQAPDVVP